MHLNWLNYYRKSCILFRLIAVASKTVVSGFVGWQAPFMAQPAHPQPQDDFPFLLPRTILAMTAATKRTKTALIMIVAIFSISHASIEIPPFSLLSI